jgi:HME family heavy-metal exporter
VIIGGLITSTVLEFLVRPALFWKFGLRAAQQVVAKAQDEVILAEKSSDALTGDQLSESVR